ncbi:MAG: hypothetical protein NTV52_22245 [Acidobacteria bacterium]|nr:hypothetical protein [Acidobacteriota bacterium]
MGQIRTIFRVCGLAVALVLSGAGIAEGAAKGETVWPMGAAAFALAFWHNTRPGGRRVWRRWAFGGDAGAVGFGGGTVAAAMDGGNSELDGVFGVGGVGVGNV